MCCSERFGSLSRFPEEKLMILIIIPVAVAIANDATYRTVAARDCFYYSNHRDSENRTRCIEIDAAASNYVIVRNWNCSITRWERDRYNCIVVDVSDPHSYLAFSAKCAYAILNL